MSILKDLAEEHTDLTEVEIDHLHRLLADWQLLADLSFADLLLWCRTRDHRSFVVVGQMRPYTAQTIYRDDLVGTLVTAEELPLAERAFVEGRIVREGEPPQPDAPRRRETIPVVCAKRVVGAVSLEAHMPSSRVASDLELTYMRAGSELAQMIADGTLPFPGEDLERETSPRVGDGLMRLDDRGIVTYLSPNAVSAFRRLGVTGNLAGERLESVNVESQEVLEVLRTRRPRESEVEGSGTVVLRRALPLIVGGKVIGALVLFRDVTELRRRERQLRSKDASIREIHHRVKNNLQTVASLLRLQSRRLANPEAKAALEESVQRITSIALVHETLSQVAGEHVPFDEVAKRIVVVTPEVLGSPERCVEVRLTGSAGDLPAQVATPLALVLAELLQNAVEHAFPERGGHVRVDLVRGSSTLQVIVQDDGIGLVPDFELETNSNLGLQIVRTLVENELSGTIVISSEEGTRVELTLPLD
ncbi:MAG: histidine kinase N-terminal domain-containing protein [Actinomycetota bacterium]